MQPGRGPPSGGHAGEAMGGVVSAVVCLQTSAGRQGTLHSNSADDISSPPLRKDLFRRNSSQAESTRRSTKLRAALPTGTGVRSSSNSSAS